MYKGDGSLGTMEETAYDSEDLLQGLLAQYPNRLAGDQILKGSWNRREKRMLGRKGWLLSISKWR
jgi:hypothetical protein